MKLVLVVLAAYLLGSLPFGYLIALANTGLDIRQIGSGGTGATNVARGAGKIAGVLTLLLDALKGAAAVWLARRIQGSLDTTDWIVAAAAVAVIVGHIFPVWLGLRGGKGVATGAGVFLMLSPAAVTMAAIIFLIVAFSKRYISLASIIAAVLIPLFVWLQSLFIRAAPGLLPLLTTGTLGAALIIFAHRANIARLIHGTESKFK